MLPSAEEDKVTAVECEFEELIRGKWLSLHHNVDLAQMCGLFILVVLNPLLNIRVELCFIECTVGSIRNLRMCLLRAIKLLLLIRLLIDVLELLAHV